MIVGSSVALLPIGPQTDQERSLLEAYRDFHEVDQVVLPDAGPAVVATREWATKPATEIG